MFKILVEKGGREKGFRSIDFFLCIPSLSSRVTYKTYPLYLRKKGIVVYSSIWRLEGPPLQTFQSHNLLGREGYSSRQALSLMQQNRGGRSFLFPELGFPATEVGY